MMSFGTKIQICLVKTSSLALSCLKNDPWHILSSAQISFEFLIRKQRFTSKESGGKVGGESSTNKQTKSQIFFTLSAIWPRVKNTEFCLQESRNAIWTYYYDGQGFQKYGITEMFAEYESLNVNSKNWRTTRVNTKDGGCEAKYLCFWKWRKFIFDLRFRDEGGKVAKMRKWIDFLKSDMSIAQWLKIARKASYPYTWKYIWIFALKIMSICFDSVHNLSKIWIFFSRQKLHLESRDGAKIQIMAKFAIQINEVLLL